MSDDVLTAKTFQTIKRMILDRGDRQTYCNMYNRNPHVELDGFHAYLHPDIGQRNINCDPERSDFDEIVIQNWKADPVYVCARVSGDELIFDLAHADILRRYFVALLAS